jgi:hypothetical protein
VRFSITLSNGSAPAYDADASPHPSASPVPRGPPPSSGNNGVLDKLDNFYVMPNIAESQCNSMREREIGQSERFDLNRRPPGPTPGGQRTNVCL